MYIFETTYIYMYMYIYITICIYIYNYMYIYICNYIYVCMHVCMYVCMHACMHACVYIYNIYIYIHKQVQICTNMHVNTCNLLYLQTSSKYVSCINMNHGWLDIGIACGIACFKSAWENHPEWGRPYWKCLQFDFGWFCQPSHSQVKEGLPAHRWSVKPSGKIM